MEVANSGGTRRACGQGEGCKKELGGSFNWSPNFIPLVMSTWGNVLRRILRSHQGLTGKINEWCLPQAGEEGGMRQDRCLCPALC